MKNKKYKDGKDRVLLLISLIISLPKIFCVTHHFRNKRFHFMGSVKFVIKFIDSNPNILENKIVTTSWHLPKNLTPKTIFDFISIMKN